MTFDTIGKVNFEGVDRVLTITGVSGRDSLQRLLEVCHH